MIKKIFLSHYVGCNLFRTDGHLISRPIWSLLNWFRWGLNQRIVNGNGNEGTKSENVELAGVGDKYVRNMKENEYGEKIKFNFRYAEIKVSPE